MWQVVARGIGFASAAALVIFLPTLITAQNIPSIPHTLEGRAACLACHETGAAGSPQIPQDHVGRTNDMCQACHRPAAADETTEGDETSEDTQSATPAPTSTSVPGATSTAPEPLPVPHPLVGREDCLECHISAEATRVPAGGARAIPHPLIGRENCLVCHQEGVGDAPKVPQDHAGRTADVCQACHQPGQIPAAATPTPFLEPIPTPIAFPRAEGVNTCFDCHSTLGGKHAEITVEWSRSIHAERDVTCADCHGGDLSATAVDEAMSPAAAYIGVPAKADVPALCASCHSDVGRMRQYGLPTDQYAKYRESVHGLRLAEGDTKVATCSECHGGHEVRKADDTSSTVYATNVADTCATCHSDDALMASYGIPTNQATLYRESVHGKALLGDQDLRAPNCATCHGTHGAAPPSYTEVADVCGSCHSATEDDFAKSPHARTAEAGPRCFTCHGHHDVKKPDEAIFLGSAPGHCGACHASDSEPGRVAQSLYDTITSAADAEDQALSAIRLARGAGMLVAPLEGRLHEARTNLITARAAQHTVDLDTVRRQTDAARSVADAVRASADADVAESMFRRKAMVVAVAVRNHSLTRIY